MHIIICFSLLRLNEDNILARLGLTDTFSGHKIIKGINKNGSVNEIADKAAAAKYDILLYDTSRGIESILRVVPDTDRDIALVLHKTQQRSLRNLYSRLALKYPARRILYRYEHSTDKSYQLLKQIAKNKSDYSDQCNQFLQNFEEDALSALLLDFVGEKVDKNFLNAFNHYLCPERGMRPLPYLWQRFFERYPKLRQLLIRHAAESKKSPLKAQITKEIVSYLYRYKYD